MAKTYDLKATKHAMNLAIKRLLSDAQAERRRKQWLSENSGAIAQHNERVEAEGVFSDGVRLF